MSGYSDLLIDFVETKLNEHYAEFETLENAHELFTEATQAFVREGSFTITAGSATARKEITITNTDWQEFLKATL